MAKQIFMATVRGIFWVILFSLFMVYTYFISVYLNPENQQNLTQGLIWGTGLFIINLLDSNMERKFFKRFWHDKLWLPFSVSFLIMLAWALNTHSFIQKLPYYQQKNEGSVLLAAVSMAVAMVLLSTVQLRISSWLRLRAEKKQSNLF